MADHINETHLQYFGDVKEHMISFVTTEFPDLGFCECGRFYATSSYGINTHRKNCTQWIEHASAVGMAADRNGSWSTGLNPTIRLQTLPHEPDIRSDGKHTYCNIGGAKDMLVVDHGSTTGDDRNMCFYLSACRGSKTAATRLKNRIAPYASLIAHKRGTRKRFTTTGMMAEEEVFIAYAELVGDIVVASMETQSIIKYSDCTKRRAGTTFVFFSGLHFEELAASTDAPAPIETPEAEQPPAQPLTAADNDTTNNLLLTAETSIMITHSATKQTAPAQEPILPQPSQDDLDLPGIRDLVPELSELPSEQLIIDLVIKLHLKSRILRALKPSHLWSDSQISQWTQACGQLGSHITTGLQDGSDLSFLQIILDIHAFHICQLGKFIRTEPELNRPTFDLGVEHGPPLGGNAEHRRAVNQVYQDKLSKAMRELLSNGLADFSLDTLRLLQAAHPKRKTRLRKHKPSCAQVNISHGTAKSFIFRKMGSKNDCLDVFGWSPDLLRPVRADKAGLIKPLSKVIARIANANVPDLVGLVLTCGSLIGINKLPEEEQRQRAAEGKDPRVRPVNMGSLFLKWAFQLLLGSKKAKGAAEALRPIQCGLGTRRGPEAVAHIARSMWEKLSPSLITDFTNGFNDFLRQAMLDAVERRCPELTAAFNMYYARDSICFFIIDGAAHIVLSMEGSRMGCVLGSFGFCLTVQDIYESIQKRFPHLICKALTDDFMISSPVVLSDADPENDNPKTTAVETCIEVFKLIQAKDIAGLLTLNDKCTLLLPPGLPLPEELPDGLVASREGTKIAGAPVGTDQFTYRSVTNLVRRAQTTLKALNGIDPQVGFLLLRRCVSCALTYLSQVTPPLFMLGSLRNFDDRMFECAMQLILIPTS